VDLSTSKTPNRFLLDTLQAVWFYHGHQFPLSTVQYTAAYSGGV